MKTHRYRSAITGRFVKEDYAKENPDTTMRVTIEYNPESILTPKRKYQVSGKKMNLKTKHDEKSNR